MNAVTPAASFLQPGLFDPAPIRAWPWGNLQPQSYDFIMSDFPWRFELRSKKGEGKSPQAQYDTMSIDEVRAMPVADLARENCLYWQWCTAPMLDQQIEVMKWHGFQFVTSGAWIKKTVNDKLGFGTGYVLRSAHEPFIIGSRGNPETIAKNVRSVIEGRLREHSRKPDAAYRAAEALMPHARRADLFSRESRDGWEAWGNETGKFDKETSDART